jgi:predicted acetyltransferase
MKQETVSLVKASLEGIAALEEFVRELATSGLGFFEDGRFAAGELDLGAYLQQLVELSEGRNLPAGWVPMTTFWLIGASDHVVGMSRLRHSLTPGLLNRGGHISYYVAEAKRGKGYGNAVLRLTLAQARDLGLSKVLVTAASDNLPSLRVIETNGGVLEEERFDADEGELYCRYWIDLTAAPTRLS